MGARGSDQAPARASRQNGEGERYRLPVDENWSDAQSLDHCRPQLVWSGGAVWRASRLQAWQISDVGHAELVLGRDLPNFWQKRPATRPFGDCPTWKNRPKIVFPALTSHGARSLFRRFFSCQPTACEGQVVCWKPCREDLQPDPN